MSDWMEVLREECKHTSQNRMAQRLGVSSSMVSQALKGVYPGDLSKLQRRVEGELMGSSVNCPVLGEISTRECLDCQRRPFAATNAQRVRLYRACRSGCPNSQLERLNDVN
ncbi:XRE family transcriptional regulator [Natronospirillum operosum]|uniref:XRE family transcriptional regulator n=1 Tax=Natronospirillum operosum TaxID=2759953 RepID=A0A4Z0W4R2_9GAMM|nr:helix-turn-helix transcriptional regulator [Natronospirillum operosum]TGG92507.1 XRE family transcriptional regulator [Natronospirillum operosum]